MHLSLPFLKGNILDCVNKYLQKETVNDNSWYCQYCKSLRSVEKKYDLWKLPTFLIINF